MGSIGKLKNGIMPACWQGILGDKKLNSYENYF